MPADGSAEGEKSVRGAAGAAGEMERLDMEKTSGERERSEPGGALSRPQRLKSVPAALFLSRSDTRNWDSGRLSCGAAEAASHVRIIPQR